MIPCTPIQQPQANAAVPRAGSGQLAHASPEALFWHFVCDEICEVLCEVICDDTERGAGTLTASAASTLKRQRAEDADARVADADAAPWVAACADLLEAAKDHTNMKGLREPLVSRGFICGSVRPTRGENFNVKVPPEFPCYYDVVGKDYSVDSLPTLRSTSRVPLPSREPVAPTAPTPSTVTRSSGVALRFSARPVGLRAFTGDRAGGSR